MKFETIHARKYETKSPVGCLLIAGIILIGVVVMFSFALGVNCLIALLAQWVATGFGYSLPFWPTVGLLFLIQIVLGASRTKVTFKK
jgi:hypothetical protein